MTYSTEKEERHALTEIHPDSRQETDTLPPTQSLGYSKTRVLQEARGRLMQLLLSICLTSAGASWGGISKTSLSFYTKPDLSLLHQGLGGMRICPLCPSDCKAVVVCLIAVLQQQVCTAVGQMWMNDSWSEHTTFARSLCAMRLPPPPPFERFIQWLNFQAVLTQSFSRELEE